MRNGAGIGENGKFDAFLNKWFWVIEIGMMLLASLFYVLQLRPCVDFSAINGTFQNYNPIRRLLSGQVPMRDFQDYLGMGHLYLGGFMTALFGGNFRASLYAFDYLSILSTLLIFWTIGYSALRDKTLTVTTTATVFALIVTQLLGFCTKVPLFGELIGALLDGMGTGNSARPIRGMILPVVLALFLLADRYLPRIVSRAKNPDRCARWLPLIVTGWVAGFSFVWSSDYGISCWVCLALMTGWISLSRSRRLGRAVLDVLVELAASAVSLFVFVGLTTRGNYSAWFQSIAGTGGYQRWYYNSNKALYLFDLEYAKWTLAQAVLCVVYMVVLFRNRGSLASVRRYAIPAFANMVCYCAANEYRLLSGNQMIEVANIVLLATVLFEGMRLCLNKKKARCFLAVFSIVLGAVWIGQAAVKGVPSLDGVYMEKLGGTMTNLGDDILAAEKFLNGERFWATYASGQEVQQDTFQPSGTDYIIHVLGDQQREDYLNKFKTGDFRYTATIRHDYSVWEYWITRANWFFYRELYENWHPVFANGYEVYWERNGADENNVIAAGADVQIEWIDKATAVLRVNTDQCIDGVADVCLDYEVYRDEESDWRRYFIMEPILHTENTGYATAENAWWYESNYLRSSGSEYIPVTIHDGYGEVTLEARPSDNVRLDITSVQCDRVFADLTAEYRTSDAEKQ